MNVAVSDVDLLRAFFRQGNQSAFAELVQRHLDLVYGTVVRKLGGLAGAEEVAQDVFAALARGAWQFAPGDSVPAWLHRTAILKSNQWIRGELRRRRREQTAAQMGTTMKTPDDQPALRALVPILDEALLGLSEKERTALLLRFIERRSLREVGASLGVSEDAAQKRVASALDRLTRFFQKRGYKTASATTACAALQHSATSAPTALASIVTQAALLSVAPSSAPMAFLARLAGWTKTQTLAVCILLAAAPLTWQWTRTDAAQRNILALQSTTDVLRTEHLQVVAQNENLRSESNRLQDVLASNSRPDENAAAQALSKLQSRLRALLASAENEWPEDLPFVRVPKWALQNIGANASSNGPRGTLAQWIQEVLDLSPDQKASAESSLSQHLGYIDRLAANATSETNWLSPDGFYIKTVKVAALGSNAEQAEDLMATNFLTSFGPQGANLLMSPFQTTNPWLTPEAISHALIAAPQEFIFSVKPHDAEPPEVRFTWQGHLGYGGPVAESALPQFLMDLYQPWLEKLGVHDGAFSHPQP